MISRLRLRLDADPREDYQIAAEIGVHPSKLSEWASGKRPIPVARIYRLMDVFHCDAADLLGFVELEPSE